MNGIRGSVAIVAGGTAGIGKAVVEKLASLGALVAVAGVDESSVQSVPILGSLRRKGDCPSAQRP